VIFSGAREELLLDVLLKLDVLHLVLFAEFFDVHHDDA
jgi:hypothetical protein